MAATRNRNPVRELYLSLTDDPQLPRAVQRRVYAYATRTHGQTLLAKLAVHPSLDPDLDERLGANPHARVRAAWVSRPGRTEQQVLDTLEECRASAPLYAAVAALPDLPARAYERVAENLSLKVAETLLANPSVPSGVKARVTIGYATNVHLDGWRNGSKLQTLFGSQMALVPLLAEHATGFDVIGWALEHVGVSGSIASRHATAVMSALDELGTGVSRTSDWSTQAALLRCAGALFMQESLPKTLRQELHQALCTHPKIHPQGAPFKQAMDAYHQGPVPKQSTSHPQAGMVHAARTDTEIAEAVQAVLITKSEELAMILARNRGAGPDAIRQALPFVPGRVQAEIALERATDLAALAAFVVHGAVRPTDTLLKASGQPVKALIEIIHGCRVKGAPIPNNIGRSEYLTPEVMGTLPLSFSAGKGTLLARRAVTGLLEQALNEADNWQMFETLGANFDGPLDNLLLACGYVTATTQPARTAHPDAPGGTPTCSDAVAAGTLPPPPPTDQAGIASDTLF